MGKNKKMNKQITRCNLRSYWRPGKGPGRDPVLGEGGSPSSVRASHTTHSTTGATVVAENKSNAGSACFCPRLRHS